MDEFYLDGMPKIYFGSRKFNEICSILLENGFSGKKALVVTGGSFLKRTGKLDILMDFMDMNGISAIAYPGISPNPRCAEIDSGTKVFNAEKCDFVMGIGGGSAMDAAKAIAAAAANGGNIWEYVDFWSGKTPKAVEKAYPVVSVPTRFGSGAEISPFSVLSNPETLEKAVLTSTLIMPKIAVVDPSFCTSLNREEMAFAITDILSHLLETYISATGDSEIADSLTETLVRSLMQNAVKLIDDTFDTTLCENISYISLLALTGITHAGRQGDFILHDLEHPLSAHYGISHGLGLGALFPHLMKFSYKEAIPRYLRLHRCVFGELNKDHEFFESYKTPESDEEKALNAVECTTEFLKILGSFQKLSAHGVKEDGIENMARDVLRLYAGGRPYLETPRKLRFSDIVEIYKQAII